MLFDSLMMLKRFAFRPFGLCESNTHETTYIAVQKNLYALKDFLDKNPQLFHSTPGDQAGVRGAATSEQEAWKVSLFCGLFVLLAC